MSLRVHSSKSESLCPLCWVYSRGRSVRTADLRLFLLKLLMVMLIISCAELLTLMLMVLTIPLQWPLYVLTEQQAPQQRVQDSESTTRIMNLLSYIFASGSLRGSAMTSSLQTVLRSCKRGKDLYNRIFVGDAFYPPRLRRRHGYIELQDQARRSCRALRLPPYPPHQPVLPKCGSAALIDFRRSLIA